MTAEAIAWGNNPDPTPDWFKDPTERGLEEPVDLIRRLEERHSRLFRTAEQLAFDQAESRCAACPKLGQGAFLCAYDIRLLLPKKSAATMLMNNCEGVRQQYIAKNTDAAPLPRHGMR
jgi:hypothetical protein